MYLLELHGQKLLCEHQLSILLEGSFWILFRYATYDFILIPISKMQSLTSNVTDLSTEATC